MVSKISVYKDEELMGKGFGMVIPWIVLQFGATQQGPTECRLTGHCGAQSPGQRLRGFQESWVQDVSRHSKESAISSCSALLHGRGRRSYRLHWVHPILRTWNRRGEYHALVQELCLDSLLFEQYFRMPPEYFDELLGKVGPLITRADTSFRYAIGPAERLAICLRYLATGDSFRMIGFSYRVGTSSVCRIVREVASAIWTALVEEVMPVPTREDWSTMAEQFEWCWNFPNCIGAIDGKHVVIQAPSNSGSLYYNYKGTFSLVLLAVVDANYLFRIVDVGGYGRTSDSGSLRNSAFGGGLWGGTLDLPPDCVVSGAEQRGPLPHVFVGDEAFPLMTNLLRPFPGCNHPPEKRVFNYRLSRAWLVVECAFGILASRWRMYRRVIATSPQVAEVCVVMYSWVSILEYLVSVKDKWTRLYGLNCIGLLKHPK
ncbi:Protein ALP1-like [Merluccius polli]|uniref:Protein ALP1-like n=1 Tax=Merluccius polli TaxID=89951 RepID=A0AA47NMY6_MERPO|nr:Protein ALP1-like [Merluccius polli]